MPVLKPQDLLLCLKTAVAPDAFGTYAELGKALGLGVSETHRSVQRAAAARLLDADARQPHRENLIEFAVHGAAYAFPAARGAVTRGMPTGAGGASFHTLAAVPDPAELPVWPDPDGTARGYALTPLYRSVPDAARRDQRLYEALALLDSIRDGEGRERALAADLLARRLR